MICTTVTVTFAALRPIIPQQLRLLHNELPDDCFVAVHAETRVGPNSWLSACPTIQPFKSIVDPTLTAVYWHKDGMEDFYGEIWDYNNSSLYLRQETYPHWPPPYDPPSAPWDVRPDKFRLFSNGNPGAATRLPGGMGRVLAPFDFMNSSHWVHRGNMTTYLCRDWEEFKKGNCSLYQPSFLDSSVTVSKWGGEFSTIFDGHVDDPVGQWKVDKVMTSLKNVHVINQEMVGSSGGKTKGRERFFFATAGNGTNLGIVRWDASVANASTPDGFTVTQRTVGLRLQCAAGFNSSGFVSRQLHDKPL